MNYLDIVAGLYILLQMRRKPPSIEEIQLELNNLPEEQKRLAATTTEISLEVGIFLSRLFLLTTGMLLIKQGIYHNSVNFWDGIQ